MKTWYQQMKQIIAFGILCAVILFKPVIGWSDTLPTAEQLEAEAVVLNYFDALYRGDTVTITTLLAGELLEKRESLLSNPHYAAQLQDLYRDAQFEVVGYDTLDEDAVAIDARISLNEQEVIRSRFILIKDASGQFLVHQEVSK